MKILRYSLHLWIVIGSGENILLARLLISDPILLTQVRFCLPSSLNCIFGLKNLDSTNLHNILELRVNLQVKCLKS